MFIAYNKFFPFVRPENNQFVLHCVCLMNSSTPQSTASQTAELLTTNYNTYINSKYFGTYIHGLEITIAPMERQIKLAAVQVTVNY